MRRFGIVLSVCIICVAFNNLYIYALDFDSQQEVTKIEIYQSAQFQSEKDLIDRYETTNENEIELILHYINSFKVIDKAGAPSDTKIIRINVINNDLTSRDYMIYPQVLQSVNDKK